MRSWRLPEMVWAHLDDEAQADRRFVVAEGGAHDVCPHCGIWRENAGYLPETCGEWFGQPGCFVAGSSDMGGER